MLPHRRRRIRRGRRSRRTRYRPPRFLNRKRPVGWLAPSLKHRVLTIETWANRLRKLTRVGSVAMELVRFDPQKMENPEVSGVKYQLGVLLGYDVREYLLEKWGRKCAYCGVKDVPLQVEHIYPKSRGGSDRVSNLTLACQPCNQTKGNQDVRDFLSDRPSLATKIFQQAKAPLKDAASVNSTRWALFQLLKTTSLPVTIGTGARTKFNRRRFDLPKEHWIDAACVGEIESLTLLTTQPLLVLATGHGCRQVIPMNKYGFPRAGYKAKKPVPGWKTGDIVNVVAGKNAGLKAVRIKTVRVQGSFDIKPGDKILSGSRNHIKPIHRQDGYGYSF